MELLSDVATALRTIAGEFLPSAYVVTLQQHPRPLITLRIPGATNTATESALHVLAEAFKRTTDVNLPALPLQYLVIGGSEAAGIEITPAKGEAIRYPTFHRITRHDIRDFRRTSPRT